MFRFPWGDMHSLNLGWFLQKFNELREDWATAEAGIDGALDAEIQKAEDALSDVFDARDAAAASATAAAGSASAANTSKTEAQNSATAAASSATLANNKATAAGLSEAAAAQSASAASISATAAATSTTQAGNSASAAQNSAAAAGQSATAAAASETAAGQSAAAAAASETAAGQSAEDAENAASSVEASAEQIATNTSDIANLKNTSNAITEPSKNLFPITGIGIVNIKDVGVEYNDGVLTLNGTATSSGGRVERLIAPITLEAGVYTYSSDVSNALYIQDLSNNIISRLDIGNVKYNTFELAEETSVYIGINVISGNTYNEVYHIQLEKNSFPTLWTKPSSISAIDTYARNSFLEKSANLLSTEYKKTTVNDVNVVYNNGVVRASGTASQNGGRNIPICTPFLLKAGTYTLSQSSYDPFFLQENNTIIANLDAVPSRTFTITEDKTVFISCGFTLDTTYNYTKYVQLEEGTTATQFHEPSFETYVDSIAREEIAKLQALVLENIGG